MKKHTLNILYSDFAGKKISRNEFEGQVFIYLIRNQSNIITRYWKNDEYEEFISWFYPRLKKGIDSYKETGASFEAYLTNIVRTAAREYRTRLIIKEVTEHSAWNAQIPEYYAREETPAYFHDTPDNEFSKVVLNIKGRKNPRQILALALKCYYYVSDDFLDRIAVHTGFDKKILKEMVEKLQVIREEKEDAIYRMKERIYGQFYRCIVYEHRLSYVSENTAAYLKLKQRLEKARNRLERMRKRISKIRTFASNKEIAGVIGVTKGSIDASLYKLKTKLSDMADKFTLN